MSEQSLESIKCNLLRIVPPGPSQQLGRPGGPVSASWELVWAPRCAFLNMITQGSWYFSGCSPRVVQLLLLENCPGDRAINLMHDDAAPEFEVDEVVWLKFLFRSDSHWFGCMYHDGLPNIFNEDPTFWVKAAHQGFDFNLEFQCKAGRDAPKFERHLPSMCAHLTVRVTHGGSRCEDFQVPAPCKDWKSFNHTQKRRRAG